MFIVRVGLGKAQPAFFFQYFKFGYCIIITMDIFNTVTTNFSYENYLFAYITLFLSAIIVLPIPSFNRILSKLFKFKISNFILNSKLNIDFLISFSTIFFLFFFSTIYLKYIYVGAHNFSKIEESLEPLLLFFMNTSILIFPYFLLQIKLRYKPNILSYKFKIKLNFMDGLIANVKKLQFYKSCFINLYQFIINYFWKIFGFGFWYITMCATYQNYFKFSTHFILIITMLLFVSDILISSLFHPTITNK